MFTVIEVFELIGEFITSSEIVEFQTHWKYRDSCLVKYEQN